MNITKEQTSELTVSLQITLQHADYEESVNQELKDYQKKASMPGFRPGKVPFGLVRKMYGKALLADKVNKLVSDALNNYIIENKISILGHPLANIDKTGMIDFDQPGDFTFHFDLGLAPVFEPDLGKVTNLEYPRIKASEETIGKAINDLRARFGEHINPENIVENAGVDFALVNDHTLSDEEIISTDVHLKMTEIVDKDVMKTFLGKSVGDTFLFNPAKAFDGDLSKARLAIKLNEEEIPDLDRDFSITVKEIHFDEPAIMDEKFFKMVFPDKESITENEFRELLIADIEKQYERETDRFFLNKAVEALVEANNVQLPDEFMKRWIVDNSDGKLSIEQVDNQYDNYARTFRWQLIESKLSEKHPELKVTTSDLRNFIKSYFFGRVGVMNDDSPESNKYMEDMVDMILKNKEEEQRIADQLAEQKLSAFMKENLTFAENPMSYEEYIQLVSSNNNQ